jgi:glucose/mannose-6-phosphate isomerase
VTITARGRSPLAQMLSVITQGDWISVYLALLNGADPTPVTAIDYLKAALRS